MMCYLKQVVLIIILIAVAGCATTGKTGRSPVPDAAAADPAAAAAETLAAIPCRCDSIGGGSPWVKFLRLTEPVTNQPRFDILSKSEYPAAVRINEKRDTTRQPYSLWVESGSIEPAGDMELLPEELVKVSFRGLLIKGQEAWIDIHPGKRSIRSVREDFDDYSIYRAEIAVRGLRTGVAHTLSVRLVPAAGAPDASIRPERA